MREKIKPGMTVLDIGANIGFYTRLFSSLVTDRGKVYAFEPDTLNFRYLSREVEDCKNVILENAAVADSSGKITLFISDDINIDHKTYDNGEMRRTVEVKSIRMDDYLTEKEKIDFIKIDIQGYDYFALKGCQELISRNPEIVIFGEFWPSALNDAGVNPESYIELLEELGLNVHLLDLERNSIKDKIQIKYYFTDFYAERTKKREQ